MVRVNFTMFDDIPDAMLSYLRYNGPHFNKSLFEFATSMMSKNVAGKIQPIKVMQKDAVKSLLDKYGVKLHNDQLYDSSYVANMCQANFLGSSVPDEHRMALYIKDVIDDPDAVDGQVFNTWYANMCYRGIAIDWNEMI